MSLGDLARREAARAHPSVALAQSLVDRLSGVALPYAKDLGVPADLALLLVRAIAAHAVGLIREAQTLQVEAQTVQIRDER